MNIRLIFLMIAALLLPVTVLAAADFEDIENLTFPTGGKGATVTTTFTVKNTGDVNLTGVTITDGVDAKYNIAYDISDIGTLNTGEEQEVEITATIPTDENSGIKSIGTVTITANEHTESFTLNLDVQSRLMIKKVEIIIDDKSDTLNNNDGTSDDKAEPGDEIKLHVEVENTFDRDSEIDINDILITAVILEVDEDEEDLEEEADEFDLEADRSRSTHVIFELPLEIEEKTFNLEIYADGESKEGEHEDFWTIHFTVDKKTHDIIITKSSLSDSTVDCGDSTTLTVELMNIGANYEDDVTLEAKNLDLELNFKQYNMDLDNEPWEEDTRDTRKINIRVPSDTKAGTYPIVIKAFYDRDALDYFKTVNLEVDCEGLEEEPEEEEEEVIEEEPEEEEEEITETVEEEPEAETEEEITSSIESPLIKNPGKFTLLLIGNLIVIGAIVFIAIKVFSSKKVE